MSFISERPIPSQLQARQVEVYNGHAMTQVAGKANLRENRQSTRLRHSWARTWMTALGPRVRVHAHAFGCLIRADRSHSEEGDAALKIRPPTGRMAVS